MMKIRIIIAAIITAFLFADLVMAGDVIVIGNKSGVSSTLSKQEVQSIFLGKLRRWDDRSKIVVAVQKDVSVGEDFLEKFIGKTSFQFNNWWKKQIFTGKGSPPLSLTSDQEMVKFISETSGAIGYVSSGADLKDVKTITVQ